MGEGCGWLWIGSCACTRNNVLHVFGFSPSSLVIVAWFVSAFVSKVFFFFFFTNLFFEKFVSVFNSGHMGGYLSSNGETGVDWECEGELDDHCSQVLGKLSTPPDSPL